MADISGTYRHGTKPVIYFESKQDGERWHCVVKSASERFEESTWAPSPWPMLERMIALALDSAGKEAEPPKYDMNRKLARPLSSPPTPLRRRGKLPAGSVPEWRPPETD